MDSRTEHNNLKQNNTVVGWVERSETGASQLCSKYKCLETSERIKGKIAKK
jgi:hypothetical protein